MTQEIFIPLPVTHPVQPHGPDSEQPNLFGLPLPKIPLNNCPLQSVVKNSADFFPFFLIKTGARGRECCTPGPRACDNAQPWQRQHSPVTSCSTGTARRGINVMISMAQGTAGCQVLPRRCRAATLERWQSFACDKKVTRRLQEASGNDPV